MREPDLIRQPHSVCDLDWNIERQNHDALNALTETNTFARRPSRVQRA
jgi:hypothetical protein